VRRPSGHDLAAVLSITLAVSFASYFVVSTSVTRWLFYLTVLPVMGYLLRVHGLRQVSRSLTWQLGVGLCLVSVLSLTWSTSDLEGYFDGFREALILALFLTGGTVAASMQKLDERWIVGSILAAAGLTGAIVLALSGQPWMYNHGDRILGFGWAAKNVNILASIYGIAAVAALAVTLRTRSQAVRAAAIVVGIICISCVVLAESRSAMLGLLAAAAAFAVGRNWRVTIAAFFGFSGVLLILVAFGSTSVDDLIARGSSYRLETWFKTSVKALEAPIFGVGAATNYTIEMSNGVVINKAHNLFLGTGYQLGVVGLAVLIGLTTRVLWSALRLAFAGRAEYLAALVFGYAILCLNAHTIVDQPQRSWLVLWLPILLLIQHEFAGAGSTIRRTDKEDVSRQPSSN
jgi:hypothetical protein